MNRQIRKEDGFTLIEILVVIAIATMFAGIGMAAMKYLGGTKASAASMQVQNLQRAAVQWKQNTSSTNYSAIPTTLNATAGDLVDRGLANSTDGTSPWQGTNAIASANAGASFAITIGGTDSANSCNDLAAQINGTYGTSVVVMTGATTLCTGGACSGTCTAGGPVASTFSNM
jgi:prepilin-type N-terminal cleavage/methylation domain-containing protein